MNYTFGQFEVDTAAREIRVDGRRLDVEPRVYELLIHLIENRDRAVGKDELQDEVWGTVVSDAAMSRAAMKLRKALSDSDESIIRTVPRYGYRFVAVVAESGAMPKQSGGSQRHLFIGVATASAILIALLFAKGALSPDQQATDQADEIRIAVLPFEVLGETTDEYLADGLTDELLNTLIQVRNCS